MDINFFTFQNRHVHGFDGSRIFDGQFFFFGQDIDCRKLIDVPGADFVTLTFTEFNTESGYDKVYVYDGSSTSAPLLGSFSGSSIPGPLTSSGGTMLVHFTSDGSVTESGWSAGYESGELLPYCLHETSTDASGMVDDNSDVDDYLNDADCQKLIQPDNTEFITLTFTEFNLEDGNDIVQVFDGATSSAPSLGSFTGTTLPGELVSTGPAMFITFTTTM